MDYGTAALIVERELGKASPAYALLRIREWLVENDAPNGDVHHAVLRIASELGREADG